MEARNGRSVTKKDHLSAAEWAQFHLNKLNYKTHSQPYKQTNKLKLRILCLSPFFFSLNPVVEYSIFVSFKITGITLQNFYGLKYLKEINLVFLYSWKVFRG